MEDFIKKRWDNFLEMGVPGFDFAVYKDGECIIRYMNGFSDLENKIPINGNERYYIYSCSKPITCVAAMQLWENGLFSLEDKLADYMPEFSNMNVLTESGIKKAEKPILIEHLFTMRAGFDYNVYSPSMQKGIKETNGRCPTREMMKYLAKEPLIFEPGERYEYSLCHDVLAALVEVISGEKFETYVKKNIFDVLGMKDSTYIVTEKEKETIIPLYRFDTETKEIINENKANWFIPGPEYASGGAGCVSTVDDYMKFLEDFRKLFAQFENTEKNPELALFYSNFNPNQFKFLKTIAVDFSFIENLSMYNVLELNEQISQLVDTYKKENLL